MGEYSTLTNLFARILDWGTGKLFYRITNADGKVWLMPVRNMRLAMNLYQPSGKKGKLLKAGFPWLHGFPMVNRVAHAERLRCALTTELDDLLDRLFQVHNPEFAVFGGTPCVHQKITIQVSQGNRILGYVKVADSDKVGVLFRKEAELLEALRRKGVAGIPRCLFCGELKWGIKLFVQSTVKTGKSKVMHEWTGLHEEFLDELHRKTHRLIRFEESDYYRALEDFSAHLDWLPSGINPSVIVDIIDEICFPMKGRFMDYSVCHMDFTPWNMFVERGKLFVFDWEYAQKTYPPRLDRYHFFMQTALFVKHWKINDFVAYVQSQEGLWINKKDYILYLLNIIAHFTLREEGKIESSIIYCMEVWYALLYYLYVSHIKSSK